MVSPNLANPAAAAAVDLNLVPPVSQIERNTLMPITVRPAAAMQRGEGSYLWDERGKRYLDFIQGWAVNALGHCPPELVDALTNQARTLISPSPALHNLPAFELANVLAEATGLSKVHFANSGAEANEAAIKLARKWGRLHRGGAFEVITTHGGFHGRTLAMMAASGKAGWDELFPPLPQGFTKVPFGDAQAVAEAISPRTVAVMVEPIQGEAGVIMPPPGYLAALRTIADRHGILLILDEVQTGIGRTGKLFAFEHEHAVPDILTAGKGLGGGLPVSAVLASDDAACFEPGDQGGTFNGTPLLTAAALAVVEVVNQPGFLDSVRCNGEYLRRELVKLGERRRFVEVRGAGLLCAVKLARDNAVDVAAQAFEAGLLINAPRADTLRFMPSLRVDETECDEAISILATAFAASD